MTRKLFKDKETGAFVVDSMCQCGHLERDHGSMTKPIGGGRRVRLPNDGGCCVQHCECCQFTYIRNVTEDEFGPGRIPVKQKDRLMGVGVK